MCVLGEAAPKQARAENAGLPRAAARPCDCGDASQAGTATAAPHRIHLPRRGCRSATSRRSEAEPKRGEAAVGWGYSRCVRGGGMRASETLITCVFAGSSSDGIGDGQ